MKKALTIVLAVIVILGMAAGYLVMGLSPAQPQQPAEQPTTTDFVGPTGSPVVHAPTSTPSVNGPAVDWRATN